MNQGSQQYAEQLRLLKEQQNAYTRSVEAQVRRSRNIGGGRAPTTTDVGLAILRTLERIGDTLDGIHDALRYSVSSLRLSLIRLC